MIIKILIFLTIVEFTPFQLIQKISKSVEPTKSRIIIPVNGAINNLLQIDSIFQDIKAVPLETKDECLISNINKVIFFENKMFLQDQSQRLFAFSMDGKFLYEIGKIGRGPKEFPELRDFDIDEKGNIYILTYRKILKFNNNGLFQNEFQFQFPNEICNPLQLVINGEGNFFLWTIGKFYQQNINDRFFALYNISNKGKIIDRYIELKYNIPGNFNRFKRFKELILIDPYFGSNIVYSINLKSYIEERYYIDFGSKTLDIKVPEGFGSQNDFKNRIDNSYYHSVQLFTEIDDWIYFIFLHKLHYYNVYYSKKLNKSFISAPYPHVQSRISPWKITGSYNNAFVGFIDPKNVLEELKKLQLNEAKSILKSERMKLEKLASVKITDNPILLICTLRKY